MRQTRGAIKFLLSQYRAILKHALLAMLLGTVSVAFADTTYETKSWDVVKDDDRGDYSHSYITGVTGGEQTFWIHSWDDTEHDPLETATYSVDYIKGNYTFGALKTSDEGYPLGEVTDTYFATYGLDESLRLQDGSSLTLTGNSTTLTSFTSDDNLVEDSGGNAGDIVLGGAFHEDTRDSLAHYTFQPDNKKESSGSYIEDNTYSGKATLTFKGAQGHVGKVETTVESVVKVQDATYGDNTISSEVVSNGDNSIGKLEIESGSYSVNGGSLTIFNDSFIGKTDDSTSSENVVATLNVKKDFKVDLISDATEKALTLNHGQLLVDGTFSSSATNPLTVKATSSEIKANKVDISNVNLTKSTMTSDGDVILDGYTYMQDNSSITGKEVQLNGDVKLDNSSIEGKSVALNGDGISSQKFVIKESSIKSTSGDVTVKKDIELIGSDSKRSSINSAGELNLSNGTTKLTKADLTANNDLIISRLTGDTSNTSIESTAGSVTITADSNGTIKLQGDSSDNSSVKAATGIAFKSNAELSKYKVTASAGDVTFKDATLTETKVSSDSGNVQYDGDANISEESKVTGQAITFNGNAEIKDKSEIHAKGSDEASGSITFNGTDNTATIKNSTLISDNGNITIESKAELSDATLGAKQNVSFSKLSGTVSNSKITSTNGAVSITADSDGIIKLEGDAKDKSVITAASGVTFNSDSEIDTSKITATDTDGHIIFSKKASITNTEVASQKGNVQFADKATFAEKTKVTGQAITFNGGAEISDSEIHANGSDEATGSISFDAGTDNTATISNATLISDNGKIDLAGKAELSSVTLEAKKNVSISKLSSTTTNSKITSQDGAVSITANDSETIKLHGDGTDQSSVSAKTNIAFNSDAELSKYKVTVSAGNVQYDGNATISEGSKITGQAITFNGGAKISDSEINANGSDEATGSITFEEGAGNTAIINNSTVKSENGKITIDSEAELSDVTLDAKQDVSISKLSGTATNSKITSQDGAVSITANDSESIKLQGDTKDKSSITAVTGVTFNSDTKITTSKVSTTGTTGNINFKQDAEVKNSDVTAAGNVQHDGKADISEGSKVTGQAITFKGMTEIKDKSEILANGTDSTSGSITFEAGTDNTAIINNATVKSENGKITVDSKAELSDATLQAKDDITLSKLTGDVQKSSITASDGSVFLTAADSGSIVMNEGSAVSAKKDIDFNSKTELNKVSVSAEQKVSFADTTTLTNADALADSTTDPKIEAGSIEFSKDLNASNYHLIATDADGTLIFGDIADISSSDIDAKGSVEYNGIATIKSTALDVDKTLTFNNNASITDTAGTSLAGSKLEADSIVFNGNTTISTADDVTDNSKLTSVTATNDISFKAQNVSGVAFTALVNNARLETTKGNIDLGSEATLKKAQINADEGSVTLSNAKLLKDSSVSGYKDVQLGGADASDTIVITSSSDSSKSKIESKAEKVIFKSNTSLTATDISAAKAVEFESGLTASAENKQQSSILAGSAISIAGNADISNYALTTTSTDAGSGDISFNGSSTALTDSKVDASGNIQYAGSATITNTSNEANGDIKFEDNATLTDSDLLSDKAISFEKGLTASVSKKQQGVISAVSSISIGGNADISNYKFKATSADASKGNISFSGSSSNLKDSEVNASGNIEYAGSTTVTNTYNDAKGNISFGGDAFLTDSDLSSDKAISFKNGLTASVSNKQRGTIDAISGISIGGNADISKYVLTTTSADHDKGNIEFTGSESSFKNSTVNASGDVLYGGNATLCSTAIIADGKVVFSKDAGLGKVAEDVASTVNANAVTFKGSAVLQDGATITSKGDVEFENGSSNDVMLDDATIISDKGRIDIAAKSQINHSILQSNGDLAVSKLYGTNTKATIRSDYGAVVISSDTGDLDVLISDSNIAAAKDATFNSPIDLKNTGVVTTNGDVSFNDAAGLVDTDVVSGKDVVFAKSLDASSISGNNTILAKGKIEVDGETKLSHYDLTGSDISLNGSIAELSNSSLRSDGGITLKDGEAEILNTKIYAGSDIILDSNAGAGTVAVTNNGSDAEVKSVSGSVIFNAGTELNDINVSAGDSISFNKGLTASMVYGQGLIEAANGISIGGNTDLTDYKLHTTGTGSATGDISLKGSSLILANSEVDAGGAVLFDGNTKLTDTKTIADKQVTFAGDASLTSSNITAGDTVSFKNKLTATGNTSGNSELIAANVLFEGDADLKNYSVIANNENSVISFGSSASIQNSMLAAPKGRIAVKGSNAESRLTTVALYAKELEFGDETAAVQNNICLTDSTAVAPDVKIYGNTSVAAGAKLVASSALKFSQTATDNALTIFKGGKVLAGSTVEEAIESNAAEVALDHSSMAMMFLDNRLDLSNPDARLYLNGNLSSYDELQSDSAASAALASNQLYAGADSQLLIGQGAIDEGSLGNAIITLADSGNVYVNDAQSVEFKFTNLNSNTHFKLFNRDIDALYKQRITEGSVARIFDLTSYVADDNSVWVKVALDYDAVYRLASGISPDTKDLIVSYAENDGFNMLPQNGYGYISELLLDEERFSDADVTAGINSFTGYSFASYAPQIAIAVDESLYNAVEERGGFKSQAKTSLGAVEGENISLWLTPLFKRQSSDSFKLEGSVYGARLKLSGLALGTDFAPDEHNRLGMALSFGKGNARSQGEVFNTINDYSFYGVDGYGLYKDGAFSMLYDAGFAHISNDVSQDTCRGSLDADFDARVLSLGVNMKYLLSYDYFDLEPHLGLRATHVDIDGFDARINNTDYLKSDNSSGSFLKIPLGVSMSKSFDLDGWQIKSVFDTAVVFTAGEKIWNLRSEITGMGRESTSADVLDTVTIQGTLGIDAKYNDALSIGLGYTFSGAHDVKEHAVSGSVRYSF